MPGDEWQKRATLRLLFAYMFVHQGKKLLFMGSELGQWREWNHEWQVDWEVLGDPRHAGLQRWVRDLNRVYAAERALWQDDYDPRGFSWIDCNDHENSVLALMRQANRPTGEQANRVAAQQANEVVVAVVNFTPVVRHNYRVGVPMAGGYQEVLNSDSEIYGGSNVGNQGEVMSAERPSHGHPYSITLTVPPLGFVLLKPNK